jgi:outer membrane protein OmpA-like peptidoglycan-associated protein
VAFNEKGPRVGRSQGASIFWGLVSVFFAAAACYYFWKNHENETSANVLRDQVLTLQEQRETLSSQKDELQSNINETETQLKTREEFLQDKETKLAEEESQIESMGQQTQTQSEQNQAQTAVVKKFNDTVRKLAKDDTDVVVRGGRPVLRVPGSIFFAFGETSLKPEGKAMLSQIAKSLNGQLDNFELRIDTFTDGAESDNAAGTPPTVPPDSNAKPAPKSQNLTSWDLTGVRAAVIARYFQDQTSLPFPNVIVVPRGDSQPIVAGGKEGHARNRRVEITIAPQALPYHSPDLANGGTGNDSAAKPNPLDPPPDKPVKKKDKEE